MWRRRRSKNRETHPDDCGKPWKTIEWCTAFEIMRACAGEGGICRGGVFDLTYTQRYVRACLHRDGEYGIALYETLARS